MIDRDCLPTLLVDASVSSPSNNVAINSRQSVLLKV